MKRCRGHGGRAPCATRRYHKNNAVREIGCAIIPRANPLLLLALLVLLAPRPHSSLAPLPLAAGRGVGEGLQGVERGIGSIIARAVAGSCSRSVIARAVASSCSRRCGSSTVVGSCSRRSGSSILRKGIAASERAAPLARNDAGTRSRVAASEDAPHPVRAGGVRPSETGWAAPASTVGGREPGHEGRGWKGWRGWRGWELPGKSSNRAGGPAAAARIQLQS